MSSPPKPAPRRIHREASRESLGARPTSPKVSPRPGSGVYGRVSPRPSSGAYSKSPIGSPKISPRPGSAVFSKSPTGSPRLSPRPGSRSPRPQSLVFSRSASAQLIYERQSSVENSPQLSPRSRHNSDPSSTDSPYNMSPAESPRWQTLARTSGSDLQSDYGFQARKLLKAYVQDPFKTELPDDIFLVLNIQRLMPDDGVSRPITMEAEFDRGGGIMIHRVSRTCGIVHRTIGDKEEEVVVRVGRECDFGDHKRIIVVEASIETTLCPRRPGIMRKDALRSWDRHMTTGECRVTGSMTKVLDSSIRNCRRVKGSHWGVALEKMVTDQRRRPLAMLCMIQGSIMWGGQETEGMFRASAGLSAQKRCTEMLQKGLFVQAIEQERDPIVWGGCLKDWLMQSDVLFGCEIFNITSSVKVLMASLDPVNLAVVKEICLLAYYISQFEDGTRMSLKSLMLMFLPVLLGRSQPLASDPQQAVKDMEVGATQLVNIATYLFERQNVTREYFESSYSRSWGGDDTKLK